MKQLVPKEIECSHCGHTFVSDRNKTWCEKCCRAVFYNAKDQKRNKLFSIYLVAAILGLVTLMTYIVIELVVVPISRL